MILIFGLCFLFLVLSALGIGTKGKWAFSQPVSPKSGYCSREMTASINGYFLTTVFMTHLIQYMPASIYDSLDFMYIEVNRAFGTVDRCDVFVLFRIWSYGISSS